MLVLLFSYRKSNINKKKYKTYIIQLLKYFLKVLKSRLYTFFIVAFDTRLIPKIFCTFALF